MTQNKVSGLCSIVCISYNHADFVETHLRSIFAQEHDSIEIIVVDDGSSDGSVKIIRETLAQSPFSYKVITQENTGIVGLNCNRALDVARGEFIVVISCDDVLLPDAIGSKLSQLLADPALVFVASTRNFVINEKGHVTDEDHVVPTHGKNISDPREMLNIEYEHLGSFYVQSGVFRAEVIDAVGRYDEDMTGDDIVLRTKIFQYLAINPKRSFALIDQPTFGYRKHSDNLHANSWRQVKTIVEWRNRFFPDRPLPALALIWMEQFFRKCAKFGETEVLQDALAFDPQVSKHYERYRHNWKYRRARAAGYLRSKVGAKKHRP